MINIFKNLNKGALVALAVAGFFAISWTEVKKNSDDEPKWYQVSLIDAEGDPNQASNQRIDGEYPGGEPTFPCEEQNEPLVCAVMLDLGSNPMPTTIAQADSLSIDTSIRLHRPEEN